MDRNIFWRCQIDLRKTASLWALQSPWLLAILQCHQKWSCLIRGTTVSLITQCNAWLILSLSSHADSFWFSVFWINFPITLQWIILNSLQCPGKVSIPFNESKLVSTYGGKLPQCYSEEGRSWLFPFCRCTILMYVISHVTYLVWMHILANLSKRLARVALASHPSSLNLFAHQLY